MPMTDGSCGRCGTFHPVGTLCAAEPVTLRPGTEPVERLVLATDKVNATLERIEALLKRRWGVRP